MAESYFEMLTEQQGIPAKPFDPLEELKRLRRELALRTQSIEQPAEKSVEPPHLQIKILQEEVETKVTPLSEIEPVTLESVAKKTDEMKNTLAIWQRSRLHTKPVRNGIFRGKRKSVRKKKNPSVAAQYLTAPQEETWQTINAGLMALGVVGIVFGILSLFRGLESDVSLGSFTCATGIAIVAIGLGGRLFASRSHTPVIK